MSLTDWFAHRRNYTSTSTEHRQPNIADDLWTKCQACGALTYTKDLRNHQMVCGECNHHMQITSDERIQHLIDATTWNPLDTDLHPADPLHFHDRKAYSDRLREAQKTTHLTEAVQTGLGYMNGLLVALGVMDFRFIGGSMGSVVGEKLTRLIERATQEHIPVVIVCASGGARMMEGVLSLMQMAKIAGALERHQAAQQIYISVLSNPTTGGVTASFAMLGDIIIAEPKAVIGFAGRRVIEQTLREKLPNDFQTAEYLLKHGFVDLIVSRTQMKKTLAQLIRLHQPSSHQCFSSRIPMPVVSNFMSESESKHPMGDTNHVNLKTQNHSVKF